MILFFIYLLTWNLLASDSKIKDIDFEKGQSKGYFSTSNDTSRFSLAAQTNYKIQMNKQLSYSFQYHKKILEDGWIALQFKQISASYDNIADAVTSSSGNSNSDSLINRVGKTQDISLLGLGYSYRFKFLQEFFNSNNIFETTSIYFNYATSLDEATKRSYSGYGITCDFGIHKRSMRNFFYGIKFSYDIASVTREAITTEPKEDRSLIYSWTSLGFEIGYFF